MGRFLSKLMLPILILAALMSCTKDGTNKDLDEPENVTASDEYSLKVVLEWDAVDNAEGYTIYRADYDYYSYDDPEDLEYDLIGTSESPTYEDYSVVSSSSYYYRIEAYDGEDEGDMSEPVLGVTISITVTEAFDALADLTDGERYNATYASDVPDIIIDVINDNAKSGTDLVFMIDNTASMSDDISEVTTALNSIIAELPTGTRLAIAVYNDKNEDPGGWFSYVDFSTDYTAATNFINDISVYGGGDYAESVYDGIYLTIDNLNWSSTSKRMMIVIGDAPPLEGELTDYTLEDVISKCKSIGLMLNLYPILISASW